MSARAKIDNIIPVILCGGSGTRLWPVSRNDYPKQFTKLVGDISLFQDTLQRLDKVFMQKPLIVTSNHMKFLAAHQMQEVGIKADIIAEPSAQNSGPAVLLAAFFAQHNNADMSVAIFASDHVIEGVDAFHSSIQAAKNAAEAGYIVTFGITPDCPSDAYGYISSGDKIDRTDAAIIKAFVEKPDTETAKDYIAKNYVWNSGNFVFHPDILITEYQKLDAETVSIVEKAFADAETDIGMLIPNDSYKSAESLSIDYAVMEKTQRAVVVTASFSWSDAGTWKSLYDLKEKDNDENVFYGDHIFTQEVHNSYIHNDSQKLIAATHLDDINIVVTEDAIMVAPKDNASHVKNMLAHLKENKRIEATSPKKVYRPWGCYETISLGGRYQVKRITVYAGASLSLQKHFHRAEHWVVVHGTAEVVNGEETLILTENQSTYIPVGAVHRLTNVGKIDLELIEVQSGSYLGEDDIVRLEDIYNRK